MAIRKDPFLRSGSSFLINSRVTSTGSGPKKSSPSSFALRLYIASKTGILVLSYRGGGRRRHPAQ